MQRPACPPQLPLQQRHRDAVKSAAAKLLRNVRRVKTKRLDLALNLASHFFGYPARALDLGLERIELVLDKAPDGLDDHCLFRREVKIHAPVTAMIWIKRSSRQRSSCLIERPSAWALVPSMTRWASSGVSSGAWSFVQGSFNAGPNCSSACRMPPSPPARCNARNVPMNAQRSPGPYTIASSISWVVAIPSATRWSASRQMASWRRSEM